jgi:hypothetical protein
MLYCTRNGDGEVVVVGVVLLWGLCPKSVKCDGTTVVAQNTTRKLFLRILANESLFMVLLRTEVPEDFSTT